jgi:hypothetical protein
MPTELSRLYHRIISAVKKCGIKIRSSSGFRTCDSAVSKWAETSCPHKVSSLRAPTILAVHVSAALPLKSAVSFCFVKARRSVCEDNFISKSSAAYKYHILQKLSRLSGRRVEVIRDPRCTRCYQSQRHQRIVSLGMGLRRRSLEPHNSVYHKFE